RPAIQPIIRWIRPLAAKPARASRRNQRWSANLRAVRPAVARTGMSFTRSRWHETPARGASGGPRLLRLRGSWSGSVPVDGLGMGPGVARRAVALGDVAQTPGDLGGRVGLPVGPGGGH